MSVPLNSQQDRTHRRILIIDEDAVVHAQLRWILLGDRDPSHVPSTPAGEPALASIATAGNAISGDSMPIRATSTEPKALSPTQLQLESCEAALPGAFEVLAATERREGLRLAELARQQAQPFAIALIGIRATRARGGIETASKLLAADREIQIVLGVPPGNDIAGDVLAHFGANDRVLLLRKPFEPAETLLMAASLVEKWRLTRQVNSRLEQQAAQIVDAQRVVSIIEGCLVELETAHDELRHHATELTERLEQRTVEVVGTRDLTMFALAQLADSRDPETGEHLLRMRAYAQLLAEDLARHGRYRETIDERFLESFYRSTPLHDIGKVGIPDQILLKPGTLTCEEFEVMKQHTMIGAESLETAARQNRYGDFLSMASSIARWHHEKYDGTGYPDGLCGDEIPIEARITALADVFDALTSARIYKDAMDPLQAKRIIESESGGHFDPDVVQAFRRCFDKFIAARQAIDAGRTPPATPLVLFEQSFGGGLAQRPPKAAGFAVLNLGQEGAAYSVQPTR